MSSLHPYLFVVNASAAISWYCSNLGASEVLRVSSRDLTVIHARLALGDSVLMLSDVAHAWTLDPPATERSSLHLLLYVDDVDTTHAQCLAHGATELIPVGDMLWGERLSKIQDPFGHVWDLVTVTEELPTQEFVQRLATALSGASSYAAQGHPGAG